MELLRIRHINNNCMIYSIGVLNTTQYENNIIDKLMPNAEIILLYTFYCSQCIRDGIIESYKKIVEKYLKDNNINIPYKIINVENKINTSSDNILGYNSIIEYITHDTTNVVEGTPTFIFTGHTSHCYLNCNKKGPFIPYRPLFDPSKIPYPMFHLK